mgnify:CR=1 FL=1
MFRLSKEDKDGVIVVTLDGQISGNCTGLVEDTCGRAVSQGKSVRLCLRDVTAVDETGWRMLLRLSELGVQIRAAGVYISYKVTELQKNGAKRPGPRVNRR